MSASARTHANRAMATMLAEAGRRRRFTGGALIQQQGGEGDGFWLIRSGQVQLCRFAENGSVTVYAVLGPGDLFGELAYFAKVKRQVDAIADGDAELVWVGAALIDRLIASEPGFAHWLLGSLAHQLRIALDRIENDRTLDAETRMARALVELAGGGPGEIASTQQELADLIGVSRVTAGQIVARFARNGWIAPGYRRLRVLDTDALRTRARLQHA